MNGDQMGAWGYGAFQNDAASSWLAKLLRSNDLSQIESALGLTGPIRPKDGDRIVAACETMAQISGSHLKLDGQPELEILEWRRTNSIVIPNELRFAGIKQLSRVLHSELAALWEHEVEWSRYVKGLIERLEQQIQRDVVNERPSEIRDENGQDSS